MRLIDLLGVMSDCQEVNIEDKLGTVSITGWIEDVYWDIVENRKDIHDMEVVDVFSRIGDVIAIKLK